MKRLIILVVIVILVSSMQVDGSLKVLCFRCRLLALDEIPHAKVEQATTEAGNGSCGA